MTAPNGSGQANDATVDTTPRPSADQAQAAVIEARASLDGARAKVALTEQHLAGARDAVAIAAADLEKATARLAEVQ